MNKKTLLIICDSHGTNWGCTGYAHRLNGRLSDSWNVTTLAYPGISLKKIYALLCSNDISNYDAIVLGVGNPDVHPRMPRKIINTLKQIGISSARDSYFSVPPIINLSYIARSPLFLIRLLITRFHLETYTTTPELKSLITKTLELLATKTSSIHILPIFKVSERVYGKSHNLNANEINNYLNTTYTPLLINDLSISENVYQHCRNLDFFHFNDEFQDKICSAIERKLSSQNHVPDKTANIAIKLNE